MGWLLVLLLLASSQPTKRFVFEAGKLSGCPNVDALAATAVAIMRTGANGQYRTDDAEHQQMVINTIADWTFWGLLRQAGKAAPTPPPNPWATNEAGTWYWAADRDRPPTLTGRAENPAATFEEWRDLPCRGLIHEAVTRRWAIASLAL